MGDTCITYGTERNRGAVENPEEQIHMEDLARMTLNFIWKGYGSTMLESEDGLCRILVNAKINFNLYRMW